MKIISPQKARKMVTDVMWILMQRGGVVYSRDMHWQVWGVNGTYACKKCSPYW
jgi:hypothetical protein